jgi:hypothetical protein
LRLRAAEELVEPGDVFEALFEGLLRALAVGQVGFAFEP